MLTLGQFWHVDNDKRQCWYINLILSSKTKYIDTDINIDLMSQYIKQIKYTNTDINILPDTEKHARCRGGLPPTVGEPYDGQVDQFEWYIII